ncbi:hypothetical protein AN639_10620 [Candidatus Epulonipiscium fishelsonii]|uniref:Uncharacterized protein n=1 Tax=Candidatus Epulonipiscium fishelsonii TaxID=77094 RepID=A0ACC8XA76_9FIRM|nr:hypothetical protein AN396_09430 [Epulopiscium sp. SCG-B11WGA-EpuloA1]ONI43343.1 hypothetical protein AN639_10620 [Epulopiscium sp. SCG-B05WGA-EpuloA1]
MTLQSLKDELAQGINKEYIYFWGHRPSLDGTITKACLSQWWKSTFIYEDQMYWCMEQFMMAEKARLFRDNKILESILSCNNPEEIKRLGRKVKSFNEKKWNKYREEIVVNGNMEKFHQNNNLKQYLLSTKDKVLVEASPYDTIWGVGLGENDSRIIDPSEWQGLNLLGFALMTVRYRLL